MNNLEAVILFLFFTVFILITGCNTNTLAKKEKEFAVKDTSKVTSIKLKNDKKEIILKKQINKWMVNNYNANNDFINYLLKITHNIQIHSKIILDSVNSIEKIFDSTFVEITIYNKYKIINNYLIAPHPVNEYCYALSKKTDEIFILFIPGYQYSLYPVFNTSVSHWRNKTLIGIFPNEIKSVTFINNFNTKNSFKITSQGKRKYKLENLFQDASLVKKFNQERIERYLSYFQHIEFVKQIEDNVTFMYDSLKHEYPEYKILIKSKNDTIQLTTYPIYIKNQVNILGDSINIDPDNLYGTTNIDSNVYFIKYTDIDPIIKKFNYFITP